jgi:hypothetical protein
LSPQDPSNYALLARVINVDYLTQKDAFDAMREVKSKPEAQKKLDALLDENDRCIRARGGVWPQGRVEYQSLLQSCDSGSDGLLQDQAQPVDQGDCRS